MNHPLYDAVAAAASKVDKKKLAQGVAAAASKVDKRKAAQGFAAVAAALARGQAHPGLSWAAGILADSLQDPTAQVTSKGSASAGAAPSQARTSLSNTVSDASGSRARPQRALIPDESKGVLRGTMSGVYDAINVGQFTFGLMRSNFNVQLSVGQMGTPGNVGGLFALETVPTSTWIRLEDRQCRKLPVWVLVHDETVELVVGSGPDNAPSLRPVDMIQARG